MTSVSPPSDDKKAEMAPLKTDEPLLDVDAGPTDEDVDAFGRLVGYDVADDPDWPDRQQDGGMPTDEDENGS